MADITVSITGNLATEPVLVKGRNGTLICEFRILVNRSTYVDGERVPMDPRPFKVVAFNNLARHCAQSLRKGDRVTVRGTDLRSEAWPHRETNEPMSGIKVRADDVALSLQFRNAASRPADQTGPQPETAPEPERAQANADDATPEVPDVLAGLTAA